MKKKYFFTLLGLLSAALIVTAIKVRQYKLVFNWDLENLDFSERLVQMNEG